MQPEIIFVGTMDHVVTRWLLKDMSYSLFENLEQIFGSHGECVQAGGFQDFGRERERCSGCPSEETQVLSLSESTLQP